MSGKCWESVGACLGYDVVVVRVVVAAERATVYPAVKRVSEVGKVSGWEGKGRVDGASGRFKQQQPGGPTNPGSSLGIFHGEMGDRRGAGLEAVKRTCCP